jgi:hypothetical protein
VNPEVVAAVDGTGFKMWQPHGAASAWHENNKTPAMKTMQALSPGGLAISIDIDSRRTLGYPNDKTRVLESRLMGTGHAQACGGLLCRSILHRHGGGIVQGETHPCGLALLPPMARLCVSLTNFLLHDAPPRPCMMSKLPDESE